MFDFPIREKNKREIKINGRLYYIEFQEPSFYEILEFEKVIQKKDLLDTFVVDFILEKIDLDKKGVLSLYKNIDSLVVLFVKAYMKIPKSKLLGNTKEESLPSSYIVSLSNMLHIDPLSMMQRYSRRQMTYLMEGYIFNKNNEIISQLKSHKKKTPEQNAVMNKCKAENATLLSKTKYESIDKEAMEIELGKIRDARRARTEKRNERYKEKIKNLSSNPKDV